MAKILVIEDETAIREEVLTWLNFEGHEGLGAENGFIGLTKALQEQPDLIICDITMPAMDGYNVLLELRSNPQLLMIPFIFLTASSDYESFRKGMELGADDYLTKPFTHSALLNAIQSRLHKQTLQSELFQEDLAFMNRAIAEEREKHLLKSRMVAMWAHDFRNPLSAILSSVNLLQRYEDRLSADRKALHLSRMEGSVRLLIQLLDDMLLLAQMERGQLEYYPQVFELSAFIEKVLDEFRLVYSESHPLIFVNPKPSNWTFDPKLLRQILANLISNAIKYSPAGGEVRIYLAESPEWLELSVQDNGIGIPEEALPQLFEAFHRAANVGEIQGTGLGLTIVKQAVDLHGGRIAVSSTVNEGTLFTVALPRHV